MLIAQAPLRVSLFGGGSDLPAYLAHHDGAVLSFAIDRRVYIVGHPFTHRHGVLLKYSKTEDVQHPSELQHPIVREVLMRYDINDMDIAVMSDVPAGTGLGSSSSFTVAMLAFARHVRGLPSTPVDLATEACNIEIDTLGEPIGYQDQWAAALGGMNVIRFRGTTAAAERVALTAEGIARLEANLVLVPVGAPRSAGKLLHEQSAALSQQSRAVDLTAEMVALVEPGVQALLHDLDSLGPLLDKAWHLKRSVSGGISNAAIDATYAAGLAAGATGGKLLGAGGSGYIAFYVPDHARISFVRTVKQKLNFKLAANGAGVIHES